MNFGGNCESQIGIYCEHVMIASTEADLNSRNFFASSQINRQNKHFFLIICNFQEKLLHTDESSHIKWTELTSSNRLCGVVAIKITCLL